MKTFKRIIFSVFVLVAALLMDSQVWAKDDGEKYYVDLGYSDSIWLENTNEWSSTYYYYYFDVPEDNTLINVAFTGVEIDESERGSKYKYFIYNSGGWNSQYQTDNSDCTFSFRVDKAGEQYVKFSVNSGINMVSGTLSITKVADEDDPVKVRASIQIDPQKNNIELDYSKEINIEEDTFFYFDAPEANMFVKVSFSNVSMTRARGYSDDEDDEYVNYSITHFSKNSPVEVDADDVTGDVSFTFRTWEAGKQSVRLFPAQGVDILSGTLTISWDKDATDPDTKYVDLTLMHGEDLYWDKFLKMNNDKKNHVWEKYVNVEDEKVVSVDDLMIIGTEVGKTKVTIANHYDNSIEYVINVKVTKYKFPEKRPEIFSQAHEGKYLNCCVAGSAVFENKHKIFIKYYEDEKYDDFSYEVYRATEKNGKYKKIGSFATKGSEPMYDDYFDFWSKNLKSNTKYWYKVRWVNKINKTVYYSKFSKPVGYWTMPKKAKIKINSSGSYISWNKVDWADGYQVEEHYQGERGYNIFGELLTWNNTKYYTVKGTSKKKNFYSKKSSLLSSSFWVEPYIEHDGIRFYQIIPRN